MFLFFEYLHFDLKQSRFGSHLNILAILVIFIRSIYLVLKLLQNVYGVGLLSYFLPTGQIFRFNWSTVGHWPARKSGQFWALDFTTFCRPRVGHQILAVRFGHLLAISRPISRLFPEYDRRRRRFFIFWRVFLQNYSFFSSIRPSPGHENLP